MCVGVVLAFNIMLKFITFFAFSRSFAYLDRSSFLAAAAARLLEGEKSFFRVCVKNTTTAQNVITDQDGSSDFSKPITCPSMPALIRARILCRRKLKSFSFYAFFSGLWSLVLLFLARHGELSIGISVK
jgi:hypothetical protein